VLSVLLRRQEPVKGLLLNCRIDSTGLWKADLKRCAIFLSLPFLKAGGHKTMHDNNEHARNVEAFIDKIKLMLSLEQIPVEEKLTILSELLSIAQLHQEEK
jgi:hypothetical protein